MYLSYILHIAPVQPVSHPPCLYIVLNTVGNNVLYAILLFKLLIRNVEYIWIKNVCFLLNMIAELNYNGLIF